MFSGIVETIATVTQLVSDDGCLHLRLTPFMVFQDLRIGDSVAVNGVCLTVTQFDDTSFHVTAVPETLRLTNLHKLQTGSIVNLERSLRMGDRIGGHVVQGHVDGMGTIVSIQPDNSAAWLLKIRIPETLSRYVIAKGYIALDGMSITVIEAERDWITVTLIPHTQAVTIAHQYRAGQLINIEVDSLGKYIEKFYRSTAYAQ